MTNVYYCQDCQRIFKSNDKCDYCNSTRIKQLKKGTSVNVIGTKEKGQVLKIASDGVTLIITNEINEKYMKKLKLEEIRKIL